ncbi:mediator of RNA polymerase II transcription subunit 31 [Physeter macrocephalus]|uniref:Mediator of RNA polymerase II transcription subunit 31 n=1 Tax=Physeter macrocephalus TaxID=9755 RepID=A0A455AWI6_PHYMC|nr:mediator of RNA polymerase II transcription subunit 31 [Physeter catodon]|eukprot:XP_028340559.1 mediator of RNA polymerase II transcription subunit 31 [Physeter catodon]
MGGAGRPRARLCPPPASHTAPRQEGGAAASGTSPATPGVRGVWNYPGPRHLLPLPRVRLPGLTPCKVIVRTGRGEGSSSVWEGEDDAGNRLRFQLELEFVQCLANPNYLNFLAQRGYFKDKAFVNYLKYLLYWKEPEYAKYLKSATG